MNLIVHFGFIPLVKEYNQLWGSILKKKWKTKYIGGGGNNDDDHDDDDN